ncbi:MAG: helix-turn-helix transcriptional regulator [Ruminiclostridium sp.]|nr:helix-turn-helix transcriptional regulator [Ruminiclostridium sp.]
MNELGNYIKQLRENVGLSQRDLSKLSKVSNTEISRIESGERQKPSLNIFKSIAPHLNVSYEQLMETAGYLEPASTWQFIDINSNNGNGEFPFYRSIALSMLLDKEKKNPGLVKAWLGDDIETLQNLPLNQIVDAMWYTGNGDFKFSFRTIGQRYPWDKNEDEEGLLIQKEYDKNSSLPNDLILKFSKIYKENPDFISKMCIIADLPDPEKQKIMEYADFIIHKNL